MARAAVTHEQEVEVLQRGRPWLVVARVAGWAAPVLAAMGWLMVVLFANPGRHRIDLAQHVAAWAFAGVGTVCLPLLFSRRRLLAYARTREDARLERWHVTGWFETLAHPWSEGMYKKWRPFGPIEMFVALGGEAKLEPLRASLPPDTTIEARAGGILLASPPFDRPFLAHRWAARLLDRLVPILDREVGVSRVHLAYRGD